MKLVLCINTWPPHLKINGFDSTITSQCKFKQRALQGPWVFLGKTVPFLTVLLFSFSGNDISCMYSLGAQRFRPTFLTDDYIESTNILLGIQNNSRPRVSIFESISVWKGKTLLLQKNDCPWVILKFSLSFLPQWALLSAGLTYNLRCRPLLSRLTLRLYRPSVKDEGPVSRKPR